MTADEVVASWAKVPMRGFDIETTGVDVANDRILTLVLLDLEPGQRPREHKWTINPGVPIPEGATAVHGITDAHVQAHGMDPGQALFEAAGLLAYGLGHRLPLVTMNGSYDLSLFEHECMRHGVDTLASRLGGPAGIKPIIDIGVLDKRVDRYRRGGRKLTDLCATYGVRHTGAHDATADALAACRLWPRMMGRPELRALTLGELHAAQVRWRKEQMDSLREYFDRKGTEHDGCDPCWPLLSSVLALTPAPF